ncbi:MAG: NAD(P)H-hydrate dehydratase, partial [Planctomycetota bacterium]|nr:NAD(P)H-hydrate dehydratase [Planctomycetota bacterium]
MVETVTAVPPLPSRAPDANKGTCGLILVVGGSRTMAGAPCLAARGAYRGGAGLVRVAVPATIRDIVAAKLDECLVEGLKKTKTGVVNRTAFRALVQLCEWADTVVMGPGMTQAEPVVELIRRVVKEVDKPFVLDADALNSFAGEMKLLKAAQTKWSGRMLVLTPHPGEMARLLGVHARDVQADRAKAVEQAALATKAVVILKGAGTLVCDGQRLYANRTGNPGMATGGSGDVLTGVIAALVGQGLSPFDAACLG